MMTRVHLWLDTLRTSLWFVPSLIVLGSVALAYAILAVDASLPGQWWLTMPWLAQLLDVSTSGAGAMLQVIGGSMITVAGVVFSITIAALTLASGQYTSRVLRNFIRDPANQVVLGSFLGIFVYCLLILRSLFGAGDTGHAPPLALLVALILAFVGIGLLIFFIHHIALGLQAGRIVADIAHEALESVDRHFPDQEDSSHANDPVDVTIAEGRMHPVIARANGFVMGVDHEALLDVAVECDAVVRVLRGSGTFITEGARIAEVRLAGECSDDILHRLADAWSCGPQRTLENDPGFGMRQLVDVAIKALSPAVNETTTGIMCVNWLGVILRRIAGRRFRPRILVHEGHARVLTGAPRFGDYLSLGMDQIRLSAAGNPTILHRQLEVLTLLAEAPRAERYRQPLLAQMQAIVALSESSVTWPPDREPINDQAAKLSRLLGVNETAESG